MAPFEILIVHLLTRDKGRGKNRSRSVQPKKKAAWVRDSSLRVQMGCGSEEQCLEKLVNLVFDCAT